MGHLAAVTWEATPAAIGAQASGSASPAAGWAWPPSLRSQAMPADLLDVASAGRADRVLFIGEAGAEMLCDALRRGCRGGSAFRVAPAHPEPVEVVVAPAVRSEEAGRAVVECARRALPAGGRLVLRVLGEKAGVMAGAVAARLRAHGFERVRLRGQAEGALLVCRLSASRASGLPGCGLSAPGLSGFGLYAPGLYAPGLPAPGLPAPGRRKSF